MPEQRWTKLEPALVRDDRGTFATDVLTGLSEKPKRLSSMYFYDGPGSALFEQITELDEYYPTRIEQAIFDRFRGDMLDRFRGEPLNLIDLGAGDGRKTRTLLEHLIAAQIDVRYVPIDISETAMDNLVADLRVRFAELPVHGLVAEYFDGIRWIARQDTRRNLVLFLGSNIGNFDRARGHAFLRTLWDALNPDDHALIGFDLKKDIEVLLAAYNDAAGITAEFNLNLLRRINRELGGDFDLGTFRHFATYNVLNGAMEMYIISLEQQRVRIANLHHSFDFEPFEPIHTEYSYKYLDSDIEHLAAHSGFTIETRYFDDARWFCSSLWRCVKNAP